MNFSQESDPSGMGRFVLWRRGLLVACLAFAVRAIYVTAIAYRYGTTQVSDFLYMHQLADSLAHGQGFTIDGARIFNQSVGYPAFLAPFYALFGAKVEVALVLNVLLGALSAWLVYILAWRLMLADGSHRLSHIRPACVAFLAGTLAAIYPDSLLYAGLVSGENLLVPLLLLTALAALNFRLRPWRHGLLVGALAAATVSVKAHVILWFACIPVLWWVGRKPVIATTCAAALAGLVCLAPWTFANYRASEGHFIPFAAVIGEVLLDGTNPDAQGVPTGKLGLTESEEAGLSPLEIDKARMRKAASYIRADPKWYLRLLARRAVLAFSPARDYMFEFGNRSGLFVPFLSRWLPTAFNALILVATIAGVFRQKNRPLMFSFCLGMLGAATILQAVFFAYSRYRYPFLVGLLPVAADGAMGLIPVWRRK